VTILVLSFLVIGLAMAGLAIGVMVGRKPLQGSCGGLNNFSGASDCELCGGNAKQCDELNSKT
jgi:hypothetical protein